jgi:hypothetical protein
MFCIFYALTAIPIFGFVNYRVSHIIKDKFQAAERKVFGRSPKKYQHYLSYTIYVVFGIVSLFLVPAYGRSSQKNK